MGGLGVKKLFFFFFPHQSILCDDFEAQVITFFLHRQGVCFNSHIEGNRGYPKFFFLLLLLLPTAGRLVGGGSTQTLVNVTKCCVRTKMI